MGQPMSKLLSAIYVLHIAWALGWIIPGIAEKVAERCSETWYCSRFSRPSGYGYTVDLADGQWREFRQSLVLLMLTALGTSVATHIVRKCITAYYPGNTKLLVQCTSAARALVGLIILFVQHGYQACVVLVIALLGFAITKLSSNSQMQFALTWAYAIAVLLLKESYRLKHMKEFQFLMPLFDRRYGGMYGWQLPTNFLVLRMVSYSCDYYWSMAHSAHKKNDNTGSLHTSRNSSSESTDATDTTVSDNNHSAARPVQEYQLLHYTAYVLYAPLYMAGPVITFDNFMQCTNHTSTSTVTTISTKTAVAATGSETAPLNVFLYLLRWLCTLALMEYLLHKYPFFAVASSGLINRLSASETAIVCYMLLKVMWMKFLLIWRFFRWWALLDGVNPPENMTRCMSNNHSLEHFWRGWHSSFNKWLVRYLYKPLGGRERQMFSVWVIFLFVALWHDMEYKLLLWGLLNAFFYVIEVTIKKAVVYSKMLDALPGVVQDIVCAAAGASYIIVLIGVNLVGYGVGVGGVSQILAKFGSVDGLVTVGCCFYFLTIAVLLMQVIQRNGWSTACQ